MCRSGSLLDGFTEYGIVCLDLDVFLSISGRSGALETELTYTLCSLRLCRVILI